MTKANDTAALAEFTKYEIAFPFFRDERYGYDSGWRIGVRDRGTDYASADAMGALLIETLAIVSPGGKYGPRVFYIQTWRGPDGEEFGARVLSCDSVTGVARRCSSASKATTGSPHRHRRLGRNRPASGWWRDDEAARPPPHQEATRAHGEAA